MAQSAPPWQNKNWALDVNNDGSLTSLDVLLVINALNRVELCLGHASCRGKFRFVDVNGDRYLTPLDALILINVLNRMGGGNGNVPPNDGSGTPTKRSAEGEQATVPSSSKLSSSAARSYPDHNSGQFLGRRPLSIGVLTKPFQQTVLDLPRVGPDNETIDGLQSSCDGRRLHSSLAN